MNSVIGFNSYFSRQFVERKCAVMSRTKKTIFNAGAGIVSLGIGGLISLYVNRLVIVKLGSDYNGVNATVNQVLLVLSLLEGGFSLASLVALYGPYAQKDKDKVNVILSTSKSVFKRIGIQTAFLGLILSLFLPFFIKSGLSYSTLMLIFLMSFLPQSFNYSIVLNYRLLFQAAQREYIVILIQLLCTVISQLFVILTLLFFPNILVIRLSSSISTMLSGIMIIYVAKRQFTYLDTSKPPNRALIKGTKEVFISNITSFFYSSSTVMFLSFTVGTKATSIYSVYYSILFLVMNVIYSVLRAPQSSLGEIISQDDTDKVYGVFEVYEHITIILVCIFMSVTYALMLPFVSMYTIGIKDTNYINEILPPLMIVTAILELIHIPSGLSINLYGDFKAVKNIQLISCFLIIILSLIGGIIWGMYGVIVAKLITALFLSVTEVTYAHTRVFKKQVLGYLLRLAANISAAVMLGIYLNKYAQLRVTSYYTFLLLGLFCMMISIIFIFLVNFIFFRKQTTGMLRFFLPKSIFQSNKASK